MWFRQILIYRIHDAPVLNLDVFESLLTENQSHPLGNAQSKRMGWVAPGGRKSETLCHEVSLHRLMRARRQERLLPASVVQEELEDRVAEREAQEGKVLSRQERVHIKEQIYEEFLPRAFIRSKQIDLWWDIQRGLIIVNGGSRKLAEDCLDLLRQSLGSLKITPLATKVTPAKSMTEWLSDPANRPTWCNLGDQAQLEATSGDDARFTAKQADLDGEEIQSILESGRQATKLALVAEGLASFVLHDDLAIKSLRFDDQLIEKANDVDDGDDRIIRLETDFVLMADTLAELIELLLQSLGGEATQAFAETADVTRQLTTEEILTSNSVAPGEADAVLA